ncbi:MAG: SLC13 family permease [Candidatus Marinimicrobia bacterium]|nr:SLC13 family permease [Candidatus Neomarinimicrobiota bacterium]
MTTDQIAIFCIITFTFVLFIWGKFRYDIVSIISLSTLFITDLVLGGEKSNLILNSSNLFIGFGHPAVITVALVLIISQALRNSGVVDFISRKISPLSNNQSTHIASLSGVATICSAIMNNVGALALMLPVALKTATKQNRSPSIILMPLAFASILGGMITMIGTPPNIIIAAFRKTNQMNLKLEAIQNTDSQAAKYFNEQNINIENFTPSSFGMLDFSPVGLLVAFFGVIFITFIGWRLIPKTSHKKPNSGSNFSIDDYVTEIRIPENCKLINMKIKHVEKYTGNRLEIFGYIDKNEKFSILENNTYIKEGDRFLVKSDPVDLKLMMDEYNIRFTKKMRERIDKLKDENTIFKEVVVTPDSPLLNRTRQYLRRKTSNTLVLMAVARQDKPIHKRLDKIIFSVGDVLLLQGNSDYLKESVRSLQLLPLEQRDIEIGLFSKVSLSLLIFFSSITLSIVGILPTTLSFIIAILLYIFTGILPVRQLYDKIDWPIIVLLGSMIPVSNALETTGTSQLLANNMVAMTQSLPHWLILALIMVITMCLSDVINNAATALIMAPIASGIAISLGVNIDPFLMAVAVGASCAFLTPIGHQCNALILGPGGYKFSDYWKMGLPLEILIVILGTPLILYFWPL